MSNASARRFAIMTASLLPALAIMGCAAVSDREVMSDGKPCNALCQRWMGVGRPAPGVRVAVDGPLPPARIVPAVAAASAARRRPVARIPRRAPTRPDRPEGRPATAPPEAASPASPTPTPPDGWTRRLPGSAETLTGAWISAH